MREAHVRWDSVQNLGYSPLSGHLVSVDVQRQTIASHKPEEVPVTLSQPPTAAQLPFATRPLHLVLTAAPLKLHWPELRWTEGYLSNGFIQNLGHGS